MPLHTIVDLFPLTSDEDAGRVVAFKNDATGELIPRLQGSTVDEFRANIADPSMTSDFFGVEDDSGVLGALGRVAQFIDGANAHMVWVQIHVRPDIRRQGLGRRLLSRAHEIAIAADRTVLVGDVYDTVPAGESFASALGAKVGMREQVIVVETAAVSRSMLEAWRSEGQGRAPGYEILQWTDGYPAQYDAHVANLFVIADEDMPFEDASYEPSRETAETVRARLERTKDTILRVTSVARHVGSDAIVGFSELVSRQSDPNTIFTMLTVVHRDHRGHALGKWLKADSILRGIERWPDAMHIQTENAHSNAPMLGINYEIGFELEHAVVAYEATVEQVRAYLDRS